MNYLEGAVDKTGGWWNCGGSPARVSAVDARGSCLCSRPAGANKGGPLRRVAPIFSFFR